MTEQEERSKQRIAHWGDSYLASTAKSYSCARKFFQRTQKSPEQEENYFTAYLYLFVTFNNLYSFIADFNGGEHTKITNAVDCIPDEWLNCFYTEEYRSSIEYLNQRTPEQCMYEPDADTNIRGVMNMQHYFQGKDLADCVTSIDCIATEEAPAGDKKRTLQDLATKLLYTIRNNQFHSIKGPDNMMDREVLGLAYYLLEPIVDALFPVSCKKLEIVKAT